MSNLRAGEFWFESKKIYIQAHKTPASGSGWGRSKKTGCLDRIPMLQAKSNVSPNSQSNWPKLYAEWSNPFVHYPVNNCQAVKP